MHTVRITYFCTISMVHTKFSHCSANCSCMQKVFYPITLPQIWNISYSIRMYLWLDSIFFVAQDCHVSIHTYDLSHHGLFSLWYGITIFENRHTYIRLYNLILRIWISTNMENVQKITFCYDVSQFSIMVINRIAMNRPNQVCPLVLLYSAMKRWYHFGFMIVAICSDV